MYKGLIQTVLTSLPLLASQVLGQCPTVDFDDLAVETAVTTQYDGVTFSTRYPNGSPGPAPVVYDPMGGTTSEPRCLRAPGDASGDFSTEYLRMAFDDEQTLVTFMLGVRAGCAADDTVQVRWYDGATLAGTRNVPINGVIAGGCFFTPKGIEAAFLKPNLRLDVVDQSLEVHVFVESVVVDGTR